jgi:LCP family protein required for cell wall assembly
MAPPADARTGGSYHVFTTAKPTAPVQARMLIIRGGIAIISFFGLVVLAALLIAISPTLSRSVTAFFIAPQSGAIPWNGTDPVNIVVAGIDLRPGQTADPHTDSLMVMSVRAGSIRMLSIPRDLWVSIPGYGYDRVNDAYADGGTKLLIKTTEGITNMPIRYFVVINFQGFEKVIDAVGGVNIYVKKTIWDPLYPALTGYGYSPLFLKKGWHHMDGRLALKYVRERHAYATQDLEREAAQQQLLSALKSQFLTPSSLLNLPVILSSLQAAVSTNFPYDGLTYLGRLAMTSGTTHRFLNYTNGAVSNYVTPAGADVLLPNWPRIHWIAHQTFQDSELGGSSVAVLNGSGIAGAAGTLTHWLRASGYTVAETGNASSESHTRTEVIQNTAVGGGGFVARMLGDQLQTRVTPQSFSQIHSPVVVIVGQDWSSPVQS